MHSRVALVLAGGLLAIQGCAVTVGEPSLPPPSTAEAHPPTVGGPVVLDTRVAGWETSAWLAEAAVCVRAAQVGGSGRDGKEKVFVSCDPAPSALATAGPPLVPAKPLPYIAPLDPEQRTILLVGVVRGAITSVSVTMFGQTTTAVVHPLPATGGRQIGAYALWAPRSAPGRNSMDLSDISAVIGRDAAGSIVARLE